MSNEVRLILDRQPVARGLLAPAKPTEPNVAVVYSTGSGEVACFDGRPLRRSQHVMSKYRFRYDVDLSAHQRTARLEQTPLRSRDGYSFDAEIDIRFHVTDPEKVVRFNVGNALPLVYGFVKEQPLREIARRYGIRNAYEAEAEINHLLTMPVELVEGITVFYCRIRLEPDQRALVHLQELVRLEREGVIGGAQHVNSIAAAQRTQQLEEAALRGRQALGRMDAEVLPGQRAVELADARHQQELAAITQQGRLQSEQREREALGGLPHDLWSLLLTHLQRHPDETRYVTELYAQHQLALTQRQDVNDQRSLELVRFMIDRDLIQPVDIESLRSDALGRVQQIASPAREELAAGSGWNDPLPDGGQVILGTAESGPPPDASAVRERVVPVYVVVDESVSHPGYVEALNAGFGELPALVSRNPEESAAIRLALIGYAEDVAVRIPMTRITQASLVPAVQARVGCRLAPLLADLRDRITADVERFKAHELDVSRPTVVVLSATGVTDGGLWPAEHARLTDRAAFRYAPNIVACGVGRADPGLVAGLASRPGQAFVAAGGEDLESSVRAFTAFVARFIASWSHDSLTGQASGALDRPAGFAEASAPRTFHDQHTGL